MAITKLNQGYITSPEAFPSYHQEVLAADLEGIYTRYGMTAKAWNEDCNSEVEVVWGTAGEELFAGALCVFAEDYVATAVDTGNIGCCGVAVGNGGITATITSGSGCWFIVKGQVRIHSDDVAAGAALYVDASNPGGVDDAAATGELVSNAFSVEADVATASVYNTTTTKCMIAYPKIDSVSPTPV
jgi:hypothetical protein